MRITDANASIAQLVVHFTRNEGVVGSSPIRSLQEKRLLVIVVFFHICGQQEKKECEKMAGRSIPRAGEIYRHFKNKMYQIVAVAAHTETGEQLVVYEALYDDFKIYARPLSMFLSEVDHEKYPQSPQKYRFELVERDVDGTLKMGYPVSVKEIAKGTVETQNIIEAEKQPEINTVKQPEINTVKQPEEGYLDDEDEINPFLLNFLDTDSYGEKLEVLVSIRSRLDDRLIDDMAAALDVTVEQGPLPVRYEGLKACLETMVKFECERFR